MVYLLVFDTETTGLPLRGAKPDEPAKWDRCRLVQLAWEFYSDRTLLSQGCYTVLPEGFTIPETAAKIHGISQDLAVRTGEPIEQVLAEFMQVLNQTDVLVAHNLEFDWHVMTAECFRLVKYVPEKFSQVKLYCTMKAGTKPGGKWPKLAALYAELCGAVATDCHRADNDVRYCAEVYFKQNPVL